MSAVAHDNEQAGEKRGTFPSPFRLLDDALDRVTMYRLVLYYLAVLFAAGLLLGAFGLLPIDPAKLCFSLVVVLSTCLTVNWLFARFFNAPENRDSVIITALILVLILDPVSIDQRDALGAAVFAAVWAVASKYLLAVRRKHIFNPAAFGVLASGVLLDQPPTWWIAGNAILLPVVVAGGVLIVRKIGRLDLVASFGFAVVATILLSTAPANDVEGIRNAVVYSPVLFLAFVMLTEPVTTPPARAFRIATGALAGVLCTPSVHLGSLYLTPELALVIANFFAFVVSPKGRIALTLLSVERSAASAVDFTFGVDQRLAFRPGQYLEFALGVAHGDNRGSRRFFTIASAPGERTIRLGVKYNRHPSAFKRALFALRQGETIYAAQLTGDFVLPADKTEKLAFIAGGIGVTPFRSMIRDLLVRHEQRPIVMIYGNETGADIAYRDVFDQAERDLGISTVYAVARDATHEQYPGIVDAGLIQQAIPDYRERTFYISGSQAMVKALRHVLNEMGVHRSRIKADFFPGLA